MRPIDVFSICSMLDLIRLEIRASAIHDDKADWKTMYALIDHEAKSTLGMYRRNLAGGLEDGV